MARENLESLLRCFADAYPADIFTPLKPEEISANQTIVTRASAGMGRHVSRYFTEAADRIAELERALETCGWYLANRNAGRTNGYNAACRAVESALGQHCALCGPPDSSSADQG